MKADSNAFINVLKEIDALSVKEVAIRPEDGGINIYAIDPSNVSIVSARIKPEAFPEGCDLEEETVLSIPFMLDALIKDEMCDMSIGDGKIVLKYKKSKRTHRLIAAEDAPRPVPNLELPNTCVLMSDDVVALMKMSCFQTIQTESGGITVRLTSTGMVFEALSDVESAEMTAEGTTELEDGEIQATFGMKVIAPLLKALPTGTLISVHMDTDMPVKITIDEETYSMDIYSAPFITEDE